MAGVVFLRMEPRAVLGVCLLVVQASILVPLVVELRRTRSAEGVSLISEVAWIVAGVGWSLYGALTGSVTLVISGALATTGSAAVWWLVRGAVPATDHRRVAGVGAVFAACMAAATAVFGAGGLSVFLSVFGLVQFVPQMVTSVRAIAHRTGAGIPLVSTGLRAVYTATWAVYAAAWGLWGIAFNEVDWPLAVWGAAGFVAFGLQFVGGLRAQPSRADRVR